MDPRGGCGCGGAAVGQVVTGLGVYRAPTLSGPDPELGSVFVTAHEIHAETARLNDAIVQLDREVAAHAAEARPWIDAWEGLKTRWRPFYSDTMKTEWFFTGSVPTQVERFAAEFDTFKRRATWGTGVAYQPPGGGGILPSILGGDLSQIGSVIKWIVLGAGVLYALPIVASWVPRGPRR